MIARSASMLLFAIGLVALAAVVAFTFLQTMTLQRNTGHATTVAHLAREAARMGAEQAATQILRDWVQHPVTCIDGPARAAFRAHYQPWLGQEVPDVRARDLADLGSENALFDPAWVDLSRDGYGMIGNAYYRPPDGTMMTPSMGIARWIEPRFHGDLSAPVLVTRASNGMRYQLPTAPVRFGDGDGEDADAAGFYDADLNAVVTVLRDATGSAYPSQPVDVRSTLLDPANGSQCAPMLFDKDFQRLPASDRNEVLTARVSARYRLRYAVQVHDLDGMLQLNPDPAIDWSRVVQPDPRHADYAGDPAHARIARHMHALRNLGTVLNRFGNAGPTSNTGGLSDTLGERMKHVFIGRGWTSNYARVSDADPWPRTFPYMYRRVGLYDLFRFREAAVGGSQHNWASNPMPFVCTELYQAIPGVPTADPAGYEALAAPPGSPKARTFAWTGPQFTPFNARAALIGRAGNNGDDAPGNGQGEDPSIRVFNQTVFGRGMHGNGPGRYGGAVTTPWSVNILTAPPEVVQCLVMGYLPPGVMQLQYAPKAIVKDPSSTLYWAGLRGINDLFVSSMSAAFAGWRMPQRTVPAIAPDYNVRSDRPSDPGYRWPQERYPGPLMFNGFSPDPAVVRCLHDDLGVGIDLAEQDKWAVDPHIGGSSNTWGCFAGPGYMGQKISGTIVDPPSDVGWLGDTTDITSTSYTDKWERRDAGNGDYLETSSIVRPHPDSFWSDVIYAFNETVSLTRIGWMRFEGRNYQPRTGDPLSGGGDPSIRCADIGEMDKLFIRCLGHDPLAPSAAPPANGAWRFGSSQTAASHWQRFTPAKNIASLKSGMPNRSVRTYNLGGDGRPMLAAPVDTLCNANVQTQVLELVVNDFRFSVFGSHPSYSKAFRPLDFNGDGLVAFSGYRKTRTGDALPANELVRTAMLVDQDSQVVAAGQGEWPVDGDGDGELSASEFATAGIDPFCVTGNFWIGRSRFWSVLVRGQVFDNLLKRPVSQMDLETWLMVDPALNAEGGDTNNVHSTQIIWQSWHHNFYKGLLLREF